MVLSVHTCVDGWMGDGLLSSDASLHPPPNRGVEDALAVPRTGLKNKSGVLIGRSSCEAAILSPAFACAIKPQEMHFVTQTQAT